MTRLAWRSHCKNIKYRANKGVIIINDWGIVMRACWYSMTLGTAAENTVNGKDLSKQLG